jgi:hypothetical protein
MSDTANDERPAPAPEPPSLEQILIDSLVAAGKVLPVVEPGQEVEGSEPAPAPAPDDPTPDGQTAQTTPDEPQDASGSDENSQRDKHTD